MLYIIVIVQRQLIEPKVLSSSIGLDPLATLIALFIGYKWIGFLGLILGPIVLVIINTLYRANVFHEIWAFIVGKKTYEDNKKSKELTLHRRVNSLLNIHVSN